MTQSTFFIIQSIIALKKNLVKFAFWSTTQRTITGAFVTPKMQQFWCVRTQLTEEAKTNFSASGLILPKLCSAKINRKVQLFLSIGAIRIAVLETKHEQ